ncbi:MAG TPA: thiamine pyrophosphate-dependent enzyme [Pirellulaceae bacterium]|nr:thiamine pyrophosphate-dependent enzyme [Pirellulaceae bacterium]
MTTSQAMPVVEALQVLADLCCDGQIVVTNQGSARIWPKLRSELTGRERALDFHYNPSTMGGAIPLALGLALAQPARDVVAVSGDGSLLMSLGSLVTVIGAGATNLTIVLLDNGIYEVTGGQQTPASSAVDYCGLARAAGFPSVGNFEQLEHWSASAAGALSQPGPRFLRLAVGTSPEEHLRFPTPPIAEQLAQLQRALRVEI